MKNVLNLFQDILFQLHLRKLICTDLFHKLGPFLFLSPPSLETHVITTTVHMRAVAQKITPVTLECTTKRKGCPLQSFRNEAQGKQ